MLKTVLKVFATLLFIILLLGVYLFLTQKDTGTPQEDEGFFSFLPFGKNTPTEVNPTEETPNFDPTEAPISNPENLRIHRLSNTDVAGATLFNKERFIEPENVPVFDFVDFSGFPLMRVGFEGEEVSALENILVLFETGSVGISTNNIFTEETEALLQAFQTENNLTSDGIAGSGTFSRLNQAQEALVEGQTEESLAARYIQKEDGSVVDIFIDTKETSVESDTVIPRIQEAFFGDNENSLVLRYLKNDNQTIETFGGLIENGSISGSFFPQNISFLSLSPDRESVFYLTEQGEYTSGTISSLSNRNKRPIFESPFSEWLPWWGTDSVISLTTKPSASVQGQTYSLTTRSGNFSKDFGGKEGLTTLTSPNGQRILYSETEDGLQKLSFFNNQTNEHVNLGIRTLSEKCTWLQNSVDVLCAVPDNLITQNLPDDWYQGLVSFVDSIWLLDTDSNAHQLVVDPSDEQGLRLDITKLQLSPREDYLIFTDKVTSLLYGLEI